MEEILASIRRIIEDSDSGRKQPDDAGEVVQDFEPAAAPPVMAEVDAFRAELRTEPEAPVSAAPVSAAAADAVPPAAPVENRSADRPAHVVLAEIGARSAAEPSAELPAGQDEAADDAGAVMQEETAAAVPFRAPHSAPAQAEHEAAPAPTVDDEAPVPRLAIVSEQTSRQVAAAFGELSEAFASRSKKTFDDKAEEMLRPMLQDWLDNNLPTLVERLVREEIERVARGA